MSNTQTTIAYTAYDQMGRVKSLTKTITGDQARTTGYTYDLAGKTITTTYPDGYQVINAYYAGSGLLSTVTGSDSAVYATCTLYEPTGKIGQIDHGNGTATRYTYDPKTTRLMAIVTADPSGDPANDIQRRTYTYSPAGDIREITDNLRGITYSYTYDSLHRLLTETNTGPYAPLTYTYNAIGNMMTKTVGGDTYSYTYDSAHKHAVKGITFNGQNHPYTYDPNGNMKGGPDLTNPGSIATRTITYNADNMPLRIVHLQATVDFVYDGNGTRAKKQVQAGATAYYIGEHFELKDGVATKYIFAGNLRVAMVKGQTLSYFHKDHLASSTAMTDAAGTVVEETEYVPYGLERDYSGAWVTDYKYTDQELDTESGLYNYDARHYDPVIGRFITADSRVPDFYDPQALNRYSYARNNPLIYVDPTGHDFWGIGGFFSNLWGSFGGGISNAWGIFGGRSGGSIFGNQNLSIRSQDPMLTRASTSMQSWTDSITNFDPSLSTIGEPIAVYDIYKGSMEAFTSDIVYSSTGWVSGQGYCLNNPSYPSIITNNIDFAPQICPSMKKYGPPPFGPYTVTGPPEGAPENTTRRNLFQKYDFEMYGRYGIQTHFCPDIETCSTGCIAHPSMDEIRAWNRFVDQHPNMTVIVVP